MRQTSDLCLSALKLCVDIFLKEWDDLSGLKPKERKSAAERLIHTTRDNIAKYPEFDELFPYMPSGIRRAVRSDALGMASSYKSNHKNWENLAPSERGDEPQIGFPDRYSLTFYDQERDMCDLDRGIVGLKLYSSNGDKKLWEWYYFRIPSSDARYVRRLTKTRKLLSPTIEKIKGSYQIKFSFEENRDLVQDKDTLSYTILAVDLGINAPATWSVMTSDGTVHAKGVIHLKSDEDRLRRLMNRKRRLQQSGKKPKGIYHMVTMANQQLSIDTTREIMGKAVLYNVDCIIFEHLDRPGKVKGKHYRERIHMWRANDVQDRVELQAHRHGMRISRVCAWGTSKFAFDGSGSVLRGKDANLDTYSLCRFQNGKVYNCDLSASMNIGARYFLRAYSRLKDCPELPPTPKRTYATLISFLSDMGLTA